CNRKTRQAASKAGSDRQCRLLALRRHRSMSALRSLLEAPRTCGRDRNDANDPMRPRLVRKSAPPTVGWNSERVLHATWDRDRAYNTFQADRFLRPRQLAHAMNS